MANDILTTMEALKSILPVFENNIIEKVKDASPKIKEPANDDIPTIFISGAIPDSKSYVAGELEYISKTVKVITLAVVNTLSSSIPLVRCKE